MAKITIAEYDRRTSLVLDDGLQNYYWHRDSEAIDCLLEAIRRVEYKDKYQHEQAQIQADQARETADTSSKGAGPESSLYPKIDKEYEDCASCKSLS